MPYNRTKFTDDLLLWLLSSNALPRWNGYQNVQEAPSEIHAEHGLIKAHGMQAIVGDVHVEATALPKRHVMRRLKHGVEAWRTQKNRMVGDATLLAA